MSDSDAIWNAFRPDPHMAETQRRLRDEQQRAEAAMAYRLANVAMPADIRSRARAWGMEAFCTVLWANAFQAGYREAMRSTHGVRDEHADSTRDRVAETDRGST